MNNVDALRNRKDRPTQKVELTLPVDVIESMTAIAAIKDLPSWKILLLSYLSKSLREDEDQYLFPSRIKDAMREHGIDKETIDAVLGDVSNA
jgi:hypothetical protein